MTDIVAALARRRAELSGEADTLRGRLAAIGMDLSHLDAVIRQFDPEHDIASIRPKRPRGPNTARPGEMSRYVLGVLREAKGPLTTIEVAQQFMTDRAIDVGDRKAVRLATKRVGMTLSHQRAKGTVRSVAGAGMVGGLGGGELVFIMHGPMREVVRTHIKRGVCQQMAPPS